MPIILSEWATSQGISNRIDRLRMQYAGNPLVQRIDHRIGVDWSDDPAVFIDVILPRGNEIAAAELEQLAEDVRVVSHVSFAPTRSGYSLLFRDRP